MELAGEISDLSTQVKFVLIPTQRDPITGKILERECSYIADFVYTVPQEAQETTKSTIVVEDVKGYRTDVYRIKKKLMLQRFGIVIKEVEKHKRPQKAQLWSKEKQWQQVKHKTA